MGRTREQQREYMRNYRAQQRKAEAVAPPENVTSMSAVRTANSVEFRVFESVEDAVREEIKSLPMAATRPTEVASALRLAQILDDPQAVSRVQAADKLRVVMDVLRGGGSVGRSSLKDLRARRNAAG